MSEEIDGHCPPLHHRFIVNLNVFMTRFVLHLHFASLDVAISETAHDRRFPRLMRFIWSAKPPQLTSCHSAVSYDITPLAPDMPPQPRPHPLPSHRSAAFSNCNVQLSPNAALLYFSGCYLPRLFYPSFTSRYFSSRMALFLFYFSQRLELRPIGEQ